MSEKIRRPKMTDKQKAVLAYISQFHKSRGYGPAYRDISKAFGFASVQGALTHVDALVRKGYLARDAHVSRSIRVIGRAPRCSSCVRKWGTAATFPQTARRFT